MSIQNCIPKDKYDVPATDRAGELGFPSLNEAIPDLLEWLQDANWPVAEPIASIMQYAGTEIVPHIRKILAGQDQEWKWAIIVLVVARSSPEVICDLQDELLRLAHSPSEGEKRAGVDGVAQEVVHEHLV
ncbi:DUF5071 domain-containing protein [Phycobacter sp. K97]|uniref:DUF5071 domain-containing protein n=1 Tax=Phycobacter sedimenti TaxID=3133977 RepID=UPI00311FE160